MAAAIRDPSSWRGIRRSIVALLLTSMPSICAASDPQSAARPPASATPVPDPAQLEREGALIGDVLIDPQNIFDLDDPQEDKPLYRLANKLHIRTQERVIRQQLLFASGEPFSQRLLEESERILRSTRYLYDASIRPIAYRNGRVDVAVATRDVWTLNPGISFERSGGENAGGIELEELNLLGTGAKLSLGRESDVDRDSTLLEYRDHQFLGAWVRLEAVYANNSDGSLRSLDIERPFYALDVRRAAGLSLLDDDRIEPLYDLGKVVDEFRWHRQLASAAWGWSDGLENGWVRRWKLGVTRDDNQFESTPASLVAERVPENRKLVYPWVQLEVVQDSFDKFRNHDQMSRTEDFHLGTRFGVQLGYASDTFGADRSAVIVAANAERGKAQSDRSTLLMSSALEGRVESGQLRNAVLDAAVRYYLKQSKRRLFFATLEASVGHELDRDTQILLGGDNGLRGYPLRYQGGEARALLTLEQRYFTNWYPFRLFHVGGAAFLDVGRTWGGTPVTTPSQGWLKDVGIGLRIGNSRSGLGNIIHVDLAFPLDGDPTIDNVQIVVETKERF